ncbi:MAG: MASE1 domain-containing protein [Leptospirales bacterium]|nr:MASE1 domain-containing protein [Leptospirales bacterium]
MTAGKPKGSALAWRILEWLLIAAAYIGGAQIGFRLAFLNSQVSPVWPPEGIALAIVLLRGPRALVGVALGAILANYLNNPHLPTALLIGAGNTGSVALAALMVRRLLGTKNPFRRRRHVIGFITIGTMPGAALSALVGVGSLYLFGFVDAQKFWGVALTWWTGEMQGLVIVAPFLYAFSRRPELAPNLRGRLAQAVEALVLLAALLALSIFVFVDRYQLSYLPIPLILWATFRFRLHGATAATILLSGVAAFYTVNGYGPFVRIDGETLSLNTSLLLLELYLSSLTVMTLLVSATVNERAESLDRQRHLADKLRAQNRSFYRFVPADFVRVLGRRSALDIQLGDTREADVAVLFSDVRSFTSISEKLSPRENIELINAYLARMAPIVESHGGFIDKFIGDAIMALFVEGGGGQSPADRAVASAVAMRRALLQFNALRSRSGELPIEVGIGISNGPVILGTVGGLERLDTTAIGDTVNLASRLESLTGRFGLPLLVSASTVQNLSAPGAWQMRPLGVVTVKGKTRPVEIYEVFDADDPEQAQRKVQSGDNFSQAFPLYVGREFKAALPLFEAAGRSLPEPLIDQYIERCRLYKEQPPPEDWSGAEVLREK